MVELLFAVAFGLFGGLPVRYIAAGEFYQAAVQAKMSPLASPDSSVLYSLVL
jgi:hypothetical protein